MRTCVNGHRTIEHGGPASNWCSICGEPFVEPEISLLVDWRRIIVGLLLAFVLLAILCAGMLGLT